MVAVAALLGVTLPYVKNQFFGKGFLGTPVMLAENPSADFGPGYYSDVNFKFEENVATDLFEELPTNALNAGLSGIKKMSIALSDEAERELLEKETAFWQIAKVTNGTDFTKYVYNERASDVEEANDDWMKYIKFQQTNIFLRGTAPDPENSAEESVNRFVQYNTYEPDQLNMDKFGLFPELDITNYVNLMGDMYNQNTELMKAYSRFEIQIDYYQLQYKSKELVKDLLKYLEKANTVTETYIPPWPTATKKTFTDSRLEEMLDDFRDDYVGPYDSKYQSDLADYKDTLNQMIEIEEGGNYYMPPPILGRGDFYKDLKDDMLLQFNLIIGDASASSSSPMYNLFAWIIY